MNFPAIRSKSFAWIFFTFVLLLLLVKLKTFFNFYDEGFAMFGPARILNGDAPYKDFWAIYPPGQFYLLAGFFKLFGDNLIYTRLLDTFIRFAMLVALFLIAHRVTVLPLAYLSTLVAAFLLASAGFYSYAVLPAMALGLWALWSCLAATERGQVGWFYLAGFLLGIAITIRWDIGAFGALSALAVSYLTFLARELSALGAQKRFSLALLFRPLKPLAPLYLPMLLYAVLFYGLVMLNSGWRNVYQQVFYFPIFQLHNVRWLAYPSLVPPDLLQNFQFYDLTIPYLVPPALDWFRFYFPLLTFAVAILTLLAVLIRRRGRVGREFFLLLALLIYGALLFNQALSRYDIIHVTPASIVIFLLSAALLSQFAPAHSSAWVKVPFRGLVICLGLLYFAPSLQDMLNTLDYAAPWGCYSHLEKVNCVMLSPEQEQAVQYIRDHAAPGEPIFVGNQKHDRIFVNDIGFYYLSGHPSGTRYHELYPGVATTLVVQKEIAAQLEASRVQWAVLLKMWDSNEPNGSALSSGVTYLDDYLHANFSYVVEYGGYQIWRRK